MTDKEAIKYLQQLYPNGGHCWLDKQRIEAIGMAIDALSHSEVTKISDQQEPVSEDFEMALAEMVAKAQKCVVEPWVVAAQWKDYLIKLAKSEEPVSETNRVVQVRRCLEEVAATINPFIDEVIEQFNLKDKSIVAKEIQYRGVGLKGDFGENIHRSDDEVIYILKEDKTVGLIVLRRTEFNNAEITMIKTEERFKEKKQ